MSLPVELFSDSTKKLQILKTNLSSIFEDIGGFVIHIDNEIGSFQGKTRPYVDYFYPKNPDNTEKCFLKEVLQPTRKELDYALNEALQIKKKNKHSQISIKNETNNIIQFQGIINKILNDFEKIKVCFNDSYNESDAAPGIDSKSEYTSKTNHLFGQIDEISANNKKLTKELNSVCKKFHKICEDIDISDKSYLKEVKKKITLSYDDLSDELSNSAIYIYNLLQHLEHVQESIKNIITNLQMEDSERQNLEKIIYFIEETIYKNADFNCRIEDSISQNRLDEIILSITRNKIGEVKDNFTKLLGDMDSYLDIVKKNINDLYLAFNISDNNNQPSSRNQKFMNICNNIKKLKDGFIKHVKKNTDMIKVLNELLYKIFTIMRKFGNIYVKISEITIQFELMDEKNSPDITNMISSVINTIREATPFYKETNYNIGISTDMHHRNLMKQEEALQKSIFSIQKVSSMLNETHNHYKYISREISKNSNEILEFFDKEYKMLSNTRKAGKTINSVNEKLDNYIISLHKKIEKDVRSYSSEIKNIKNYITKTGEAGDYRNLMILSLLTEYCGKKSSDKVIFF